MGPPLYLRMAPHGTSQVIDLRHTLATDEHTCTVIHSIEAVVVSVSDSRNSSATVHLFYDECKHWTLQLSPLQTLCGLSLVCELPSLSVRAVRLSLDPSLPLFDVYWSCPLIGGRQIRSIGEHFMTGVALYTAQLTVRLTSF